MNIKTKETMIIIDEIAEKFNRKILSVYFTERTTTDSDYVKQELKFILENVYIMGQREHANGIHTNRKYSL